MSECNCKAELEAGLTERFKAAKPEAKDHRVTLEGYGLAIVDNTMVLKPFMPAKATAKYPRKGGGQHKTATEKKSLHAQKVSARILRIYGCTVEEWREHVAAGLIRAFRQQKRNASARGIPFLLTFQEWLGVWMDSGKIDGRGRRGYVMSRRGDAGPYALGNVYIQTSAENGREAMKQWVGKTKPHVGVFNVYPGTSRPFLVKVGKTRLGYFETQQSAAEARASYCEANAIKLISQRLGSGRGWTLRSRCKANPYQVCIAGKCTYYATQAEAEAGYQTRCAELLAARIPQAAPQPATQEG